MEQRFKLWKYCTNFLDFLMKYFKLLILALIVILLFQAVEEQPQANLAKLYLRGPILQSDDLREQIEKIKSHPGIKGVLLIVDSPGGSIGASIEAANLIRELRDHMPVITHVEGVMASGSYYAGMYSDKIIANRGAIIGSIGVVLSSWNTKPLLDKIGIAPQTLQEGEYKSIGTFFREWKQQEKKFLQDLLSEQYKMFIKDTIEARNLTDTNPKTFADGKIFSAATALKLGLIDSIGSQNQAVTELVEIAQVKSPLWLKKSKTEKLFEKLNNVSLNLLSNFFKGQIQ